MDVHLKNAFHFAVSEHFHNVSVGRKNTKDSGKNTNLDKFQM